MPNSCRWDRKKMLLRNRDLEMGSVQNVKVIPRKTRGEELYIYEFFYLKQGGECPQVYLSKALVPVVYGCRRPCSAYRNAGMKADQDGKRN
jgi:hypothetical protein